MCKSTRYYGYCSCLWLALVLLTGMAGPGVAGQDKKEDAPIAVSAAELTKAYRSTTDGNKTYLGKTLIVEGKVIDNTKIVLPTLILEGDKEPKEKKARRVICTMKRDFKASDVKVGDTVKIQGVCKGNGIGPGTVELDKCEVVK